MEKHKAKKSIQKINQEIRPEKYSGQRKKERDVIQNRQNRPEQKPEETDYNATEIQGLN